MTTPGGAPCDLCGEELAVISVMQLATFDQLLIGQNCLLPWVAALRAQLTGQQDDADAQAAEDAGWHEAASDGPPATPDGPLQPDEGAGKATRQRAVRARK